MARWFLAEADEGARRDRIDAELDMKEVASTIQSIIDDLADGGHVSGERNGEYMFRYSGEHEDEVKAALDDAFEKVGANVWETDESEISHIDSVSGGESRVTVTSKYV